MEYRYKAFISYRHLDFDKKTAITLQKKLESFKGVPGGEKWRIFRDESELPTSNDLSNDIRDALDNSEFLIVVCSEKTKESQWCTEEVTYFKSIHENTTRNILTLLISGNPEEVFIDELCKTVKTYADEAGNEIFEEIRVEPLAANITADSERASFKKLDTEIFRIIAPLSGLKYDDLYNRSRRRRNRIIGTAVSGVIAVLLAFSIYNSYMLSALRESTRLQDIENSRFLVAQANSLYENGQFENAQKMVLETYPSEGEDKTVIPEAEELLAKLQGAYEKESLKQIGTFNHEKRIDKIYICAEGTRLVTVDSNKKLYIWDMSSGELIVEIEPKNLLKKRDYIGDSEILIEPTSDYHLLKAMNVTMPEYGYTFTFSPGGRAFNDYTYDTTVETYENDCDEIRVTCSLEKYAEDEFYVSVYDGSIRTGKRDFEKEGLKKDTDESGKFTLRPYILDYIRINDMYSLATTYGRVMDYIKVNGYYYVSYLDEDSNVDLDDTVKIAKISEDGERVWETEARFSYYGTSINVEYLDRNDTGMDTDLFVTLVGNSFIVTNPESGEEIIKYSFENEINDYYYTKDGRFYVLLSNGMVYLVSARSEVLYLYKKNNLGFDVTSTAYRQGIYAVTDEKNPNIVRLFNSAKNDNYEKIISIDSSIRGHQFNSPNTKLLIYSYEAAWMYDFEKSIFTALTDDIKSSGDGGDMKLRDAYFIDDIYVMCVYGSLDTGFDYYIYNSDTCEQVASFHYENETVYSYRDLMAVISGELPETEIQPLSVLKYIGNIGREECSKDLKQVVKEYGKVFYAFNIETMVDSYPDMQGTDISGTYKVYYSEYDGSYAIKSENIIRLFDESGKCIASFSFDDTSILNAYIAPDCIYIACEDGYLYKGDFDGKLTQSAEIFEAMQNRTVNVKSMSYAQKYDYLLVNMNQQTLIIDPSFGKVRFSIEREVEYNKYIDKFIVYPYKDDREIGTYPVYPVGTIYDDIRNREGSSNDE